MPFVNKIEISVDGKKLKSFSSLTLQQSVFGHHSLEIVCRRDTFEEEGSIILKDSDKMLGSKIDLKISTEEKDKNEFSGIITQVSASKREGSFGGDVILSAESPDIILDDGDHSRSFEEKSLDKIVKQVLKDYQLDTKNVKPKNASGNLPYIVQYKESSYAFINRLAIKYGQWFFYNGTEIVFGELPTNSIELNYGRDLSYFDFSMKLDDLKFKYLAYDYLKKEILSSSSGSQSVSKKSEKTKVASDKSDKLFKHDTLSLYNHALSESNPKGQIDDRVKLIKSAITSGLISVSGSSDNPNLTLGSQIKIVESVRQSDNSLKKVEHGEYILTSLSHNLDLAGNYQNNFSAIPVEIDVPPYSSPHAIPFCETQSAKVLDNNDPEAMGRIKVQFPWQETENLTSPWLRMITPHAGKEKGFYFIPEIDDEVLVGFEGGNAEKPYIIGSLYNGKEKPDTLFDQDNNIKAIRTKSGHTIEFNDKEGAEELKIYDYNKENYVVTLASHSKEIKIESLGNIAVEAKGNIDIRAEGDMNLEATGDLKIKASNIKIDSDQSMETKATNVKSEASAKMEIKAGATMDVQASAKMSINGGGLLEQKGGLIKIN